jgi:single-stranded-DNA-specific exonuclease
MKTNFLWSANAPLLPTKLSQDALFHHARLFNVHPFIIKTLHDNHISTEESLTDFFYPSLNDLSNPFLINEMKQAVNRIQIAMVCNEKIIIFGDYDCDGITSAFMLYHYLKSLHANVSYRLPLRSEGYGLKVESTPSLIQKEPGLVITLDNGTNSHEAIIALKQHGIDVIVADHHSIFGSHPPCFAFVNCKRLNSASPYNEFCGAGVTLKLIQALSIAENRNWKEDVMNYIEYAAIGTIADVVTLTGENRSLVSIGMAKMKTNPSQVLSSLFHKMKISANSLTSQDIAFKIVPLCNAAGRIDDPNRVVELFSSAEVNHALIDELIFINEKRKVLTQEQTLIASEMIRNVTDPILVISGPFHPGIIGLISSRITEEYRKPSIIISEEGKGSARSLGDFNLFNAIHHCSDLLINYGGHHSAAGLSMEPEKVALFGKTINAYAFDNHFETPRIKYDAKIPICSFPASLLEDLKILEPFGNGNPKPVFFSPETHFLNLETFGKKNIHAKFLFSKQFQAYYFSKAQKVQAFKKENPCHFLYTPDLHKEKTFYIQDVMA